MFNKLSTQIGSLFFLASGIILGSIYWLEYQTKSKQLPATIENEAMLSTQLIASGISNAVHYQKSFKIWKEMMSIKQNFATNQRMHLRTFAILNKQQQLLAHSNPEQHPIMKKMPLPTNTTFWHQHEVQITQQIHLASDGRLLGYIVLTFDATAITTELRNIRDESLLSLLFALLLAILFAIALSYRVSVPLRHITSLAKRIGDGNIDSSGFANKVKEIKALAQAIHKADSSIHQKNLALIKHQKLLKSILDHSPAVIFIKDTQGRHILVNERYEQLFHTTQTQVIGKTNADIFGEDIAKQLNKHDSQVISNSEAFTMEEVVPDERGIRHYLTLKFPLLDAKGNVEAICGIATDITDQKKSNESIQKLATVLEQASELVILTDKDGHIEYVNKAFEEVSGYKANEVLGKTPSIVKGGQHSQAFYANMWQQLYEGHIWHGDFINKTKSGNLYEVNQSITPIKNEQGDITGFSSVQRDVTQLRQVQQKLQHMDRVESLGVLAGGIAHDFNNLLTAILGNAALASKHLEADPRAIKYLSSIEAASYSAADLCRQMLAYSGKGKFVIEAINLSDLVNTMGKLIEVSIEKNIVLKYNLANNIPAVDADIAQIKQIILNLITNAAEAIEHQSGVVSITTGVMHVDENYVNHCISEETLKPGQFVYLEVSDTGSGMSKETQKKIFDPFFTTKFTGRGLGMSAMLGIVQGHHGGLRIYSELGRGTTIKVILPISESTAFPQSNTGKQASAWHSSGTVLVIDDEESLREVARLMLEDIGFNVITANDGLEGVEAYRKHHDEITLVLLDMTMPRMDGHRCFHELCNINANVRVVLSSGYNEQDATNRFSGKGLAGFIQKPYSPDALASKLQEALQYKTNET